MITVHVNGETRSIEPGLTLAGLVILLQLAGKRIAVEHNGQIISRSRHTDITLRADDRIEIVQAIGGG